MRCSESALFRAKAAALNAGLGCYAMWFVLAMDWRWQLKSEVREYMRSALLTKGPSLFDTVHTTAVSFVYPEASLHLEACG